MNWTDAEKLLANAWSAVEDAFQTGEPGAYDDDAKTTVGELKGVIDELAEIALFEAELLPHHNLRESSPGEYLGHREANFRRFFRAQQARTARSFNRRMVIAGYALEHKRSRYDVIRRALERSFTYR